MGAGFTVIEEGTGAGAYTIEGGSNGGWLEPLLKSLALGLAVAFAMLPILLLAAYVGVWLVALLAAAIWFTVFCSINDSSIQEPYKSDLGNIAWSIAWFGVGALIGGPVMGLVLAVITSGAQNNACFWQK